MTRSHSRGLFFLVIALGFAVAGEAATPLRIVTFNAEILAAPYTRASRLSRYRFTTGRRAHFERVANIVETLNPDILNLLEVTSVEAVDLLVKILHEKGHTDYRGYHIESRDTFAGLDVALIARIKPDEIDGKSIRSVWSSSGDATWRAKGDYVDDQGMKRTRETSIKRNALYNFTIGKHRLGFLGLHFKSNPEDAYSNAIRTAEATVAQRVIRKEIVDRGYVPIVLGDLNDYDPDVPDYDDSRSTVTQVIRNLKDYDPESDGDELVNAASLIQRKVDRATSHWDRNENGAADSDDVYTMLDHILLPREMMPWVKRAFISKASDQTTSDHWPVVVDLMLP
ncbi:MAG: hypothetical protein MI757_08250 [Pirellulales bacterium]|nr:hypothetical protein [Pirellulales bacterium]